MTSRDRHLILRVVGPPLTVVLWAALLASSCGHQPPTINPADLELWRARQAVIALGTVQRAAIALNETQACTPLPCHPFLSDAHTKLVIDAVGDAVTAIRAAPNGWLAVARSAVQTIRQRVDADPTAARLRPYLVGLDAALEDAQRATP